jgi:hypothetical protein
MIAFLTTCLIGVAAVVIATWTAGAIYFDLLNSPRWGAAFVVFWIGAAIGLIAFWHPIWKPFLLLLVIFTPIAWWWYSQKPSHERNWDPNFARLPRFELSGDSISVENVRDTEYRTFHDNTPRFETRQYRLSQLQAVDVLVAYWGSRWMCHPMFVFDFGADGRLCISIEVRYRVGQRYSLLRSFYRQQELMYVACDERDAILRRTKFQSGQDLYLYRLLSPPIAVRSFLFEYANSINSIADQPQWYHGLTNNCTTSIYSQGRGRIHWDWRMLFNGALDRMLYDNQLLHQQLPFIELKRQSWINEIADSAPKDDFGDFLRQRLSGYNPAFGADPRLTLAGEHQL